MQPAKNNHVDPPQQEELDKAFLRIIYVFDQQATKEKEKILVTDTMALDIAQNWSVYYDWNKEQRDSVAKVKDQKLIQTLKSVNVLKDPDNEIFERFEAMNRKPEIMNDRKGEDARIFKNRSDNTIKRYISPIKRTNTSNGLANIGRYYFHNGLPLLQSYSPIPGT